MKKASRLLPALFAVPAVLLRVVQNRSGFDGAGLAVSGSVPGVALCVLLAAAAAYFIFAARALPTRQSRRLTLPEAFDFAEDPLAAAIVATGALLLLLAGAAAALGYGSLRTALPAPLAIASAPCLLYAVFGLRRGGTVRAAALLVPVCALAVYLVLLYRADASNPVLAQIYVEILAVAALTCTALELAAYAFCDGSARMWQSAASLSALLSLTAAADGGSVARTAFFIGSAFVTLGFLTAAKLE